MSTHLRTYDVNLTASGGSIEDIVGSTFEILSAQGPFQVRTQDGLQLDLLPGQGVENIAFRKLEFVDKSGAVNTIRLVAGGDPERVVLGRERFIDKRTFMRSQSDDRAAGNLEFGSTATPATAAANFSKAQLWNPSGSGKLLVCTGLRVIPTAAGLFSWSSTWGVQANLVNNGYSKSNPVLASTVAQVRQNFAAQSMATIGVVVGSVLLDTVRSTPNLLDTAPIAIRPNGGLTVGCETANTAFTAVFDWYEL